MAVYRVDLLAGEPDPVFHWVSANIPKPFVVRTVAYKTGEGWYFKCVFKRRGDAEMFHPDYPSSDSLYRASRAA
jgi:hypothetical protein